jgi:chitin synthase
VVRRALTPSEVHDDRPRTKDTEDSYKSFRTGLVYSWLMSNIVLIIGVTSDDFVTAGVGVLVPLT